MPEEAPPPPPEKLCPGCGQPMPPHLKWHGFKCYSLIQQKARRRIRENPGITLEELHAEGIPVQLKTFTRAVRAYEKQSAKAEGRRKPEEKEPANPEVPLLIPSSGNDQTEGPTKQEPEIPSLRVPYWKVLYIKAFAFLLAPFIPAYVRAKEQRADETERRLAVEYRRVRAIEADLKEREDNDRELMRIERLRIENMEVEARRAERSMKRAHENRVREFEEGVVRRYAHMAETYDQYKERAQRVPEFQARIEALEKQVAISGVRIRDLDNDLAAERIHSRMLAEKMRLKPGAV